MMFEVIAADYSGYIVYKDDAPLKADELEETLNKTGDTCDHAIGLTGWGTLWYVSDGEFPIEESLRAFDYCPDCGAPLAALRQEIMEAE